MRHEDPLLQEMRRQLQSGEQIVKNMDAQNAHTKGSAMSSDGLGDNPVIPRSK